MTILNFSASHFKRMIFTWAPLSVLHSRFFARRTSSQKELRSGRGADSGFKSTFDIQNEAKHIKDKVFDSAQIDNLKRYPVLDLSH